jgi:signal peptidase I
VDGDQSGGQPGDDRARHPHVVGLLVLGTSVLAGAWLALAGGLLLWSTAPVIVGWQPRLVLSGSMEPGLKPGDVVLTAVERDPRSVVPGQVIVVADPSLPSGSFVHRAVRHESDGRIVTRGDANRSEDFPSATTDRVLGEARLVVPLVGRPVLWARLGNPVPLIAVALVTIAAIAAVGWPYDQERTARARRPHARPHARPRRAGLSDRELPSRWFGAPLRGAQATGAVFGFVIVVALLAWTPLRTGLLGGSTDHLLTLDKLRPTSVTARPTASACLVSWTAPRGGPRALTYDVLDGSGSVLVSGVSGASASISPPRRDGDLLVRARSGSWTSAGVRVAGSSCRPAAPG